MASKVSRFLFPTKINKHLRSSGNVKQFVINVKKNVAPITQLAKKEKQLTIFTGKEIALSIFMHKNVAKK